MAEPLNWREVDFRGAVLAVAVAGGVLVTALTELLNLQGALSLGWLAAAWGTVLGAAGILLVALGGLRGVRGLDARLPWLRGLDLAMTVWIAVVVAVTGALALSSVPINYDSMTYHLARVEHWAQHRSVDFYPTHIIRQLYQPPWAEYAVLHLFILARGDRLANLVQWASMVASLVGVSVIARQLGAGVRGQILSAFVCATIPMGILQASTTQNDYVAALWVVCLASALLALKSRPALVSTLGAGASLGLAVLTKGTSYIFAAPLVLAFVLAGRNRRVSTKIGQALMIGVCVVALNAPHYARNLDLFGAPIGPGGEGRYRYVNDGFSPSILVSNVLRNVGLHVGTPSRAVNVKVEQAINLMHKAIGIAPDDPRSTWPDTRLLIIPPLATEDVAPNGLHLLLIGLALVGAWKLRGNRSLVSLAGCLVAGFLLFCLLLRWQPWHSRLQLPLFVLAAPLIGVVFERLKPAVLAIVLLALVGASIYFLTQNPDRPLDGKQSVFRLTWAQQRVVRAGPAYVEAARFVTSTGCRDVGLAIGVNDREYFLWGLLADAGWRGRLEPVAVGNVSARLPYPGGDPISPCAIVRQGNVVARGLSLGTQCYRAAWSRDEIQVLVPDAPAGRLGGCGDQAADVLPPGRPAYLSRFDVYGASL